MTKKILVVDDTPDARELMASILGLEQFEVVMAADGVEGIELARSESPDLIITDLTMPRLPGLEMIHRLREMAEFKTVPILAVTSTGMERAVEAIKAGANRALARPIENHLLLAFVFDLLKKDE
ncbi:MAG TPA: response regulator [Blastocatellia bacterium]|nr:response regulator [Blastocatellia bacterium]